MAATPLYGTPEFWKEKLGDNPNLVPPSDGLLAEIYNQLYYSTIVTNLQQIVANVSGATYTNSLLIGKTIFNIFMGERLETTQYSFDNTTGTITWNFTPTDGLEFAIEYTA